MNFVGYLSFNMFAFLNKTFLWARYLILSLANVLLLGLHFCHHYYQFTNLHGIGRAHLSNSITAIHIVKTAEPGWHYKAGKNVVLDKRYSPTDIYCLLSGFPALSGAFGSPNYLCSYEQMYGRAVFFSVSSRGPPAPVMI